MKLLKISNLYKKKKRDDKDTPKNDPNMSNSNTVLSKDNNTVNSNDLRKSRTTESNNDIFSNCDQNSVNTRSFEHTKGKNKHRLKNMKSYSTHQNNSGVLDSNISDSDDAKQENNKLHSSNNRKNMQPIINNTKRPLQHQHRQRRMDSSSYKMNPDTVTVISTSSNKASMNDPVIARMQDRHRNQVKMAALRKQQILLEDEEKEKRQSPGSVYSPPSRSTSVSSFSGNNCYPHQQSPLPPMVPYMVLSPYATPMMDPYMYHSHARPLQTSMSSYPSYVSLPASLQHNQHSLYNEQQQQREDNKTEFGSSANARARSTSVLPTLTKTNTYEKGISSSQSSSDTELSTPSKEYLAKEFTALDEADDGEDSAEADIESNNEDDSTEVGKLRQKDNHHSTLGYTRTRSTKNEEKAFEEYFNHCDKMQAYQQQWYGQQQQQQQQYPIYSPYYFQSAPLPPPPPFYAGMDPYYAQQDRRTSLMSNGPISQG